MGTVVFFLELKPPESEADRSMIWCVGIRKISSLLSTYKLSINIVDNYLNVVYLDNRQ
jgi:hypothetical protein